MTVEEALVALLAAVAGILLFLGLAQALDNRPPNRPSRHHLPEGSGGSRLGEAPSASPRGRSALDTPAAMVRPTLDSLRAGSRTGPSGSFRLASRYSASDLPPAG